MNKSLLDLSGKIEPSMMRVFQAVEDMVAARHVRYLLVEATASALCQVKQRSPGHRHASVSAELLVDVDTIFS